MNNTSLQKSHSKISNFKLTLISIILCISINGAIISLALYGKIADHLWAIACSIFGILSLISLAFFSLFKR